MENEIADIKFQLTIIREIIKFNQNYRAYLMRKKISSLGLYKEIAR